MAQQSPYVDPNTQDFQLLNGSIVNRNSIETLVGIRLMTPRGSYIFDRNLGNPLQNIGNMSTDVGRQSLQRSIKLALDDLVTLGYVRNVTVSLPVISSGGRDVAFEIYIVDNLGNPPQRFDWSLTL